MESSSHRTDNVTSQDNNDDNDNDEDNTRRRNRDLPLYPDDERRVRRRVDENNNDNNDDDDNDRNNEGNNGDNDSEDDDDGIEVMQDVRRYHCSVESCDVHTDIDDDLPLGEHYPLEVDYCRVDGKLYCNKHHGCPNGDCNEDDDEDEDNDDDDDVNNDEDDDEDDEDDDESDSIERDMRRSPTCYAGYRYQRILYCSVEDCRRRSVVCDGYPDGENWGCPCQFLDGENDVNYCRGAREYYCGEHHRGICPNMSCEEIDSDEENEEDDEYGEDE